MDGIAALATTANAEVANRVNSLEKDNAELRKCKLIFCFYLKIVLILWSTWVRWFTAVWMTKDWATGRQQNVQDRGFPFRTGCGATQYCIQWVMGYFALQSWQFVSESDPSALFGKDVENEWNVTSILCIPLHFYDMIFCNIENITLL